MPPSPSGPNPKRQRAERAGLRAEMLASWFLRLKGYRILATRYRTPVGEIDDLKFSVGEITQWMMEDYDKVVGKADTDAQSAAE